MHNIVHSTLGGSYRGGHWIPQPKILYDELLCRSASNDIFTAIPVVRLLTNTRRAASLSGLRVG